MSIIEDVEKDRSNLFRVPPIRKLFSSQTMEESDQDSIQDLETFKVFVRIKPIADDYSQRNTIKIVNSSKLICKPPSTSKLHKSECVEYTFSRIFSAKSTQPDIFNDCVVPCIRNLLNLQNSLIFTYGTTNAGKTYTVQGHPTDPGIIPRTLFTLFNHIRPDSAAVYIPYMAKNYLRLSTEQSQKQLNSTEDMIRAYVNNSKYKNIDHYDVMNYEYQDLIRILEDDYAELDTKFPTCSIWISFIELYNEVIFDLLECPANRRPLKLSVDKHTNFYVKELKHIVVRSFEEAYTIYRIGKKNLSVASTKMNETSSRSHCIFTIKVINHNQKVMSNLSICDLAGSERQTKAQNFGVRLKESGTINSSLFQLNRCLRTLRENQTKNTSQIVPFRQSKLTKLFHTVFNEKSNEKIVMIVNINPSAELYDETQQVLKMCAIASKIKSKPIMPKILRQSTRFTSYVYGKDYSSLLDEDRQSENDYFECDEDSDEVQSEETHLLKERLAVKEHEINKLKEQCEGFCKSYHEVQNLLSEYMVTTDNNQKMLEDSHQRTIEFYKQKIKAMENNAENLCSSNDLRNEILEKDLMIEELKLQLHNKGDSCPSLNNVKFQEEIYEKNKKNDELESLLSEGKTAYKMIVDDLKSMSEELNTAKSQLREKTELAEALEMNLSQKQIIIEDLEARIENLEEMQCDNTIEHEMILSNLEKQMNDKLELAKEELATTQKEKQVLEQSKVQLEHQLKTFEETIIKLTNNVDSMNAMANEQKQLISDLERERDEANAKLGNLTQLNEEIDSWRNKHHDLKKLLKQAEEQQLETENQLSLLREELKTSRQENESLNIELKTLKERVIFLEDVKISSGLDEMKRYNTRNRTPLKRLGKENKPVIKTPTNNSSSKKAQQKYFETDGQKDSVEPEIFRVLETENGGKESTTRRKKKLFSTPSGGENLISFESTEKDKGKFLDCDFDSKPKSAVATPAQTVKASRKKRLN